MPVQRSLFAVVLIVVALACSQQGGTASGAGNTAMASAPAAADPAQAKQAIEAANTKFADAMKKSDTATALGNYADDAIVMMPGDPAWHGRAAFSKGFAGFLSQMAVKDMSFHTDDVMVSGDLAVEQGTYQMTLQPKSGKAVVDNGKYLTVWKRQPDASWKIVRDINNTDVPAKT